MLLFNFLLKKFKQENLENVVFATCIHSLALSSVVFVPEVDKLWPVLSSQTSLVQKTEEPIIKHYVNHQNPQQCGQSNLGGARGKGSSTFLNKNK